MMGIGYQTSNVIYWSSSGEIKINVMWSGRKEYFHYRC